MIIRNGILSTVRSKGKTVLFTLLIFVLTLSLGLGLGLWSYCTLTLQSMEETYTSIAVVEYMGDQYPEEYVADEAAREALNQLGDIAQIPGVELWETTSWGMALSDGYQRRGSTVPYENQMVVAVFNLVAKQEQVWGVLPSNDLPDNYLLFLNANNSAATVKLGSEIWENIPFLDLSTETVDTENLPDIYCTMGTRITLVDETKGVNKDISFLFEQGNYFSYNAETEELSGLYMADMGYIGIIGENLYSYEGKSGVAIQIDPGDSGFVPEKDGRYLLHGEIFDSGSSNRAMVVTDFYEGCEASPWVAFDSYDDPVLHEGIFAEYAEKYELGNNYIRVDASDDIGALEPFQQGMLYLLDGRFPAAGEQGVCVISNDIAEELDLKVGDSLPLSMMQSTQQDPFALEETGESQTWTVVGIANQAETYEGRVWVSRGQAFPRTSLFGYQLGRAVLDNDLAVEAVEQMEALVPDGVRITLFDQGYSAAAQPLQAMESTAQGVTFASLIGVVAVLFLFAFLFVGRQQQAVDVMTSLGTPKGKIRLWLLSGATLVCGVAVLAGMVISAASMQLLVQLVLKAAAAFYAADQRYSNGALGITKDVEMVHQLPLWPSLVAGVVVFGVALVLCVAFVGQAQRKNTLRRGKTRVRVPKSTTSVAGKGALRFAYLSARRGGWRSLVVPVVSLVLSAFLGFLMATAQGWADQRATLYENTTITGQFTSTNGRQYTGLVLANPWKIWNSGMLSSIEVNVTYHYWLEGEMPQFANNDYGADRKEAWIKDQSSMVFLNGLQVAPEFIYGEVPSVTWLEGWDESFLADPSYHENWSQTPWPCVASERWMKEQNLSLGDEIPVNCEMLNGAVPVKIVGSFNPAGGEDNLYLPLSYWCLPPWDTEDQRESIPPSGSFPSACFTLDSAYHLEAFREYLAQEGYNPPGSNGSNRVTVVLNDHIFNQTVQALNRYITLGQILFPVLFILMGVLGFVVSWLMVNGRRMEFAIMRGMGAPKKLVFGSFFLEQVGLCLMGSLISGLVVSVWSGQPMVWLAIAVFVLCYLAGCALAVRTVGKTNIFALLTQGD